MNTQLAGNSRARVAFRKSLLHWYDENRRDLPWRESHDPYRVWVSEIMLQQTRVGAVLEHYRRFLERFPDVQTLARAREQSVLAAWSGLGYYRRARNLHACAKVIAFEGGGRFPATVEALRELPGIGRYTAAAIASIAFQQPNAVVDGNVERVLNRVTGDEKLSLADTWALAEQLLSRDRPGDFNQAMMELGATVCLPGEPRCLACPVMQHCIARGGQAKGAKEVRTIRQVAMALSRESNHIWLVQRSKSLSLMPGMWELPEIECNGRAPLARFKHSILNIDYEVAVLASQTEQATGRWVRQSNLSTMALTGLARKILQHFELL